MKKLRTLLSLFLALSVSVNSLPVSVLAVEVSDDIDGTAEDFESDQNSNDAETYVIGEIGEKREESIKHFRMSDGSFAAAQYSEPVHYQDTYGDWHDIDNTLNESEGRYVSENGDVIKSFASSMEDKEIFNISYKGYSIGMTFIVPAEDERMIPESEMTEEEEPEPIPDAQIESTDEDEGFGDINDHVEEPIISDTGIGDTDALTEEQEPSEDSDINVRIEGKEYTVYKNNTVQADMKNSESEVIANQSLSDALENRTSPSVVKYELADKDIEFVYENNGYNIKESILIHKAQEDYVYAFILDLQELTPETQENGSIYLENENKETVFEIPAPLLQDTNGITSDAAEYTLDHVNENWILTVKADPEWMNDNERSFPVILDPSIIVRTDSNTIYSTYVHSGTPDAAGTSQELYCGYNNSLGNSRIAMQITSLPDIPTDCTATAIGVGLYHTGYYNSSSLGGTSPVAPILIEVHELNDGITNLSSQTWNTLNAKINSKVIDYQKGRDSSINNYLEWDISSTALKWYENGNTNTGLIFTSPKAQTEQKNAKFNGTASQYNQPAIIVTYRCAIGLENYYSYQQASAGRAGSISISDFTNQMTAVHTDISYSSEATPFTLYHVYNSEHSKKQFTSASGINTKDFSSMVIGSGWKLSAQQTIISSTIGETEYLIFNDADGTDHYFQKNSSGIYEDEDGLNLKITVSGSTYTMADEDADNTWIFHNGYLITHQDLVGNKICYAYNNNYNSSNSSWKPGTGSTNRLVQIVSVPAGQNSSTICTFGYTGNDLTSITDYAGRITTYSFAAENNRKNLKYIQYPEGYKSRYEYDNASGWMKLTYDEESQYGLEITQRTCLGVRTADKVREYTAPTVNGTKTYGSGFHAYRNSSSLTSYRFYGPDHISDNEGGTGDDTVLYVVLDHWGRSICSYETNTGKDTMLGVAAGSYTKNLETEKTNNRLTSASVLGLQVENIIIDGGVELGRTLYWHSRGTSNTKKAKIITDPTESHTGAGSLKCEITSDNPANLSVSFYEDIYLEQGKTYVFSGYINTDFTTVPDSSKGAYLTVSTTSYSQTQKSNIINYSTYTSQNGDEIDNYDGGWEKVSVSFTPDTTKEYRLSFVLDGVKGTAYADDFQVERRSNQSIQNDNIGAGSTNLLTYGSFDGRFQEVIFDWTGSDFVSSGSNFLLGTYCVETTGDTGAEKRLTQTVPVQRSAEDLTFVLSGWGKADSISSAVAEPNQSCWRYFGLIATINYTDSTTEDHYVSFSPEYTDWQFASGNIVPKQTNKTVESITVSCAYNYNANTAKFDNICLVREPMQTYSYDSDGKLQSAKDGDAKSDITYVPGTHRPQSYTTPGGLTHTLTYTSNHLLATDTVDHLVTTNTYNNAGSLTSQKIKNTQYSDYLQTVNTYSSSSHYLTSTTDANDITSLFSYNSQRNLQSSQTGNNDARYFSYFTDSDRIRQTYVPGKAALLYAYGNGALTQIQRKSFVGSDDYYQRYNLTNDSFGNTTAISVSGSEDGDTFSASITLAEYEFEEDVNNGRLKTMTWPNGDSVTYTYDTSDRITCETYAGTVSDAYDYVYDGMGHLAEKNSTGGNNTEKHVYQYDGLGRLYHSSAYVNGAQTFTTSYLYDIEDRLKQQSWKIGTDAGFTEKYSYSSTDSTLSSLGISIDISGIAGSMEDISADYLYTPLKQIKKKTINYNNSDAFYRAFAYRRVDSAHYTNQIEYMNYRMPDGTLITGNKYSYDSEGRITSILPAGASAQDITYPVTYTYNTMGQLVGCADQRSGSTVTYSYTYDTAGNILSSTGDTSKTYHYENGSWHDLLTKISIGNTTQTIAYPTSDGAVTAGTPLTWYNGDSYTFTWKKGTQLATVVKDNIITAYSYDMDGIRNSKTVGNTVYQFGTLSGKVMHQTGGERELWFVYDENGQPFMIITKEGTDINAYWYLLNAMGDVIGLLDSSQQIIAEYSYDPYGRIISEWTDTDDNIGIINPLRYRGYYYDYETGFYYLESRYYDPVIGRFISPDTFATTNGSDFLSYNMFAYCLNDPVNGVDDGGNFTLTAIAVCGIAGAVVGFTSQVITNAISGKEMDHWGDGALGAALGGAVCGCVGALDSGIAITAGFAGAFGEAIWNQIEDYFRGIKECNAENIFTSVCTVARNTVDNGIRNTITGIICSQVIPTNLSETDIVDSLVRGPDMAKTWGGAAFGNFVAMCGDVGNAINKKYQTPKKTIKTQSRKTKKSVSRISSRRASRPVALVA